MADRPIVSARGVYYDLTKSPYEYINSYGDCFKFSSQKKLDIYTRDVPKEIERVGKMIARNDLDDFLPQEILHLIYRETYKAFYRKTEG